MTDNTNHPEIDIDKIMERIRAEVSRRRGASGAAAATETQYKKTETAAVDTSMTRSLISSAETHADIARMPSMLRFQGLTRKLAVFTAGKITYLSSFITKKQRNFNLTIVHALKTLTENLEKLNARIESLSGEDAKTMSAVEEIRDQLRLTESAVESVNAEHAEIKSAIESAVESINAERAEVKSTVEGIREQITQTGSTVESARAEDEKSRAALINALNEKADRIDKLENTVSYLKYTITMQERQVSMFLEKADKRLPEHFSIEETRSLVAENEHLLDALYVYFEDRFRGTREDIKERVKVYLPYIKAANAGTDDSPLLDIGCGRGEWLELLNENGLKAKGVEINSVLANECRERNLEVIEKDAILYLKGLPDAGIGALTGLHIIEHLPFKVLISLLDETVRVLKSGGIAIFETPNPENVLVGSCNFYLDPTHRKPLPSSMVKFMAEARGLSGVEILNLHPVSEAKRLSGSDVADRFNEYFYGPQDYAVVGYKS